MLKNVTFAGQYDDLCRTCHGALAADGNNWKSKGKDIRLTSHLDGRDTANALAETDGTLLLASDPGKDGTADPLTNQCVGCHATHSSGNSKLFVSAFSGGNDCTACHLRGDRFDNYIKHGHGKTIPDSLSTYEYGGVRMDLAMPCTDCHVALDTSTTNLAGTRKKHNEKRAVTGNRDDYKANFNLSKNVNSSDLGTETGNPKWGICISCHSLGEYKAHMSSEGEPRGCQDCHDEHSEGAGSTSNVFMISEKSKARGYFTAPTITPPAAEAVLYTTPRFLQDHVTPAAGPFDFYRADGKGSCDNTECHGAGWVANPNGRPGPLSTLMGTSSADTKHSGGYFAPGIDCEICHTHNDAQGGWAASASCDSCHGSNGFPNLTGIARAHTDANESLAYHNLHANSTSTLVAGCADCHGHNGIAVPPNTGIHANGTVNFGGPRLAATLNYSASGYATVNCTSANSCHDADNDEWKLGLNATVADSCADCHASGTKTLSQGGYPAPNKSSATKHTRHINNTAYVSGGCADCHGTGADTGAHTTHVNGTADTAATAKLTSYDRTTGVKTCVTSCHLANTANDWTDAALLVCADCHAGSYVGGGANMPATGLHTGTLTVTGVTHDDSFQYNGGGSTAVCTTCHGATTQATHANGTLNTTGVVFNANVGFTDGAPPTCAPSLAGCHSDQRAGIGTWSRQWHANGTATNGGECAGCHGGTPLQAAPTTWTAWNSGVGTLVRPDMTGVGGTVALTGAHDADWNSDAAATEISPNHAVCKDCHGMNTQADRKAAYVAVTMWDPTGVNSYHGNGSIDLNGPSADINAGNNATPFGAEYNGNDDASLEYSDYSCVKACHQGAGNLNHNMGDSAWPLQYKDFGAGNCNGCHGYPPLASIAGIGPGNYQDAKLDTDYSGYAHRRRRAQRPRSRRPDGAVDARLGALSEVPPRHEPRAEPARGPAREHPGDDPRDVRRQGGDGCRLDRRRRTDGLLLHERELPRRRDDALLERRHDHRRDAVHAVPHLRERGQPCGGHAVEQRDHRRARGDDDGLGAEPQRQRPGDLRRGDSRATSGCRRPTSAPTSMIRRWSRWLPRPPTCAPGSRLRPARATTRISTPARSPATRKGATWARLNDRAKATALITDTAQRLRHLPRHLRGRRGLGAPASSIART